MNDKKKNPLEGIFAQVTDDDLLRENGLLYAENKQLKSNWNSLRELLINEKKLIEEDEFFCNLSNKDYIEFILDKMNELEGKDKE